MSCGGVARQELGGLLLTDVVGRRVMVGLQQRRENSQQVVERLRVRAHLHVTAGLHRGRRRQQQAGRVGGGHLPALVQAVDEVTARAVRAEAGRVERPAEVGLVLGVARDAAQLAGAVSELALVAVAARPVLVVRPAQLRLVALALHRRHPAARRRHAARLHRTCRAHLVHTRRRRGRNAPVESVLQRHQVRHLSTTACRHGSRRRPQRHLPTQNDTTPLPGLPPHMIRPLNRTSCVSRHPRLRTYVYRLKQAAVELTVGQS